MNITQRLYETRFKMITSDQHLDPFYFLKNIDLIRSRKTMYPMYKRFYLKKKPQIPYKSNLVMENNKRFSERMGGIMNKKVVPKINNVFLELEERLKNNRIKTRNNKIRALTLENEKYANRVWTQKPIVLNAKYLKKLYSEKHDKYIELLLRPKKIKIHKKMKFQRTFNFNKKLPNISATTTDGFNSRYKSNTENMMETTYSQSKENSLELTEQRRNEMIHNKPGYLHSSNK